jgi:trk system potassium uptake protein TrkH
MTKLNRIFNFVKFFTLVTNLIILLWMVITYRFEVFLLNFIIITTILISFLEIVISYVKGVQIKVFHFTSMSIVVLFWFSFLYFTNIFKILKGYSGDFVREVFVVLVVISLVLIFTYFVTAFRIRLRKKGERRIKPYKIISLSFFFIISAGTILLFLPFSHQKPVSFVDCLFTATSAVCVTGLTVLSTNNDFTLFGQLVLLALIQIGGLGLMVFTTLFSYLLGEKMSVFDRIVTQNAISAESLSVIYRFSLFIVISTFLFEAIGTMIFYKRFSSFMPVDKALFYSIFHSVSAFCNAGFSLYDNNFMDFRGDVLINLNLMSLIVIGGIGFPVIYNFYNIFRRREKNLSLHTKIVLITTGVLIIGGAVVYFLLENGNLFKNFSTKEKILASFFASITARTAGFNTIDYSMARDATLLFTCVLMFIGASPASTGGGIKTTSFTLIVLNTFTVLRDRKLLSIFDREISYDSIRKSIVVFFLSLCLIVLNSILILFFDPEINLKNVMFEVFSAFGTVGLSTGITPKLSTFSKLILILTMFFGRVGPITIIFSLGLAPKPVLKRLPEEKVITG